MKNEHTKLAKHLLSLYKGVGISDEALKKIESKHYDSSSSRFEIITDIDAILITCDANSPKVNGVNINALSDDDGFTIQFTTGPAHMLGAGLGVGVGTPGLKGLLESMGLQAVAGPFSLPDNSTTDQETELADISVLNAVVQLIISIERHEKDLNTINNTNPLLMSSQQLKTSVLTKYASKLEDFYLKPLLDSQ